MKITLESLPLKKKNYEVKQTVKNMRLTQKLQKDFAETNEKINNLKKEIDNTENGSDKMSELGMEMLSVPMESTEKAVKYIADVLKLTNKEVEKIEDALEQDEVIKIANEISMKLLGVNPADLEESKK
ncbi:phage tail tube assembly chaperone [Ligilactobacillus sp. LYQ135]